MIIKCYPVILFVCLFLFVCFCLFLFCVFFSNATLAHAMFYLFCAVHTASTPKVERYKKINQAVWCKQKLHLRTCYLPKIARILISCFGTSSDLLLSFTFPSKHAKHEWWGWGVKHSQTCCLFLNLVHSPNPPENLDAWYFH